MTGPGITPLPLGGAIHEFVLEEMETFISRLLNTVSQYIVVWHILDLCLEVERRSGSRFPKRWWGQEVMIFVG